MSTTRRMILGSRGHLTKISQEACASNCEWVSLPDTARCEFLGLRYIPLDQVIEDPVEKCESKSRFNFRDILFGLWEILFPDRGREAYRRLEGEDMTPVVAYKSGDSYYLADGGHCLAAARYRGQVYVLAEVYELASRK